MIHFQCWFFAQTSSRSQSIHILRRFSTKSWAPSSSSLVSREKQGREDSGRTTHLVPKSHKKVNSAIQVWTPKKALVNVDILFDGPVDQKQLDAFVDRNLKSMSCREVGTLLLNVGKKRKSLQLQDHVWKIADKLETFSGQDISSGQELSDVLYGMRSLSSFDEDARKLLQVVGKLSRESSVELTATDMGKVMLGLQNFGTEFDEVTEVLPHITDRMNACKGPFNSRVLSAALYGLKNMTSDEPLVRRLITVISGKIRGSPAVWDPQAIANALFGLQGCRSDHPEVLKLLSILDYKVATCRDRLSSHEMSMALLGLQGMSSRHEEVSRLLSSLETKLVQVKLRFTAQGAGNALKGLRRMSSEDQAVRDFLSALSKHVASVKVFDGQALASCFYGMHNMKVNEHAEARAMAQVLCDKLLMFQNKLTGTHAIVVYRQLKHLRMLNNDAWDLSWYKPPAEAVREGSRKVQESEVAKGKQGEN